MAHALPPAEKLLLWLRQHASQLSPDGLETPLETTRSLGKRFGVSNSTASRMLAIAEGEGLLWKKANGRYYVAQARPLVERPKPLACVLRRLEDWSAMYRALMEGICAACGEAGIAVMLWPDPSLVSQQTPDHPPRIAGRNQQRQVLELFLRRYGSTVGGIVWDHVWDDTLLAELTPELPPGVMACRQPAVPGLGSVGIDYSKAAPEALAFLLGRGYEQILLVEPFTGDPLVEQTLVGFESALQRLALGRAARLVVHSPLLRNRAIAKLNSAASRTALVCPEDNTALELFHELQKAGMGPERVGLFSAQGSTVAAGANLSRMETNYRGIGRECIAMVQGGDCAPRRVDFQLVAGQSTL